MDGFHCVLGGAVRLDALAYFHSVVLWPDAFRQCLAAATSVRAAALAPPTGGLTLVVKAMPTENRGSASASEPACPSCPYEAGPRRGKLLLWHGELPGESADADRIH